MYLIINDMIRKLPYLLMPLLILFFIGCNNNPEPKQNQSLPLMPTTPIMGWSSWNEYNTNISEEIIMAQADAMVSTGMKDAGYTYINIDDGYFYGRDENGKVQSNPQKFPDGMAALAAYIKSKGLKAGIYTDAGINTCASCWSRDTLGMGVGLWGHDRNDITQYLVEWGYDFIKVDWCGAEWMELEQSWRYTQISNTIREIRPDAVFNICSWGFPGTWVVNIADSWRISYDIKNNFESILYIIDLNADLWEYSSPGHVNDMDMLQVGRGMSYDEDKSHFTMWCFMNSPLIAGNDLINMSQQTLSILTNRELIAINQDPMGYQARRLKSENGLEVWARPLIHVTSGEVAVALFNRTERSAKIGLNLKEVGIDAEKGYHVHDLWQKTNKEGITKPELTYEVPSHGIVALRIKGENIPYNIFQTKTRGFN